MDMVVGMDMVGGEEEDGEEEDGDEDEDWVGGTITGPTIMEHLPVMAYLLETHVPLVIIVLKMHLDMTSVVKVSKFADCYFYLW